MKAKTFTATLTVILLSIIFVVTQVAQVSAFSVKELLGLGKPEQQNETEKAAEPETSKEKNEDINNTQWAETSDKQVAANPQIDLEYVSLLINNMNEQERNKVLSEIDVFKQLVENEANNRSTVSAAIANKLEQDRNVEFLMRRGAEKILYESYLKLLITNKLPADFPTSEQIQEYYESNKQQFVVPERIHVWQIFFNKSPDLNKDEIEKIKKKANQVLSNLKKGKADFASVALAESEHEQSKVLGGYMGLVKVSDLLPDMKQTILKLNESELSKLTESETGFHIIKRGKILKEETLALNQVQAQIKKLLINQANTQLRNAIITQARKEYPQDISDKKIEEWHLRLRTNTLE